MRHKVIEILNYFNAYNRTQSWCLINILPRYIINIYRNNYSSSSSINSNNINTTNNYKSFLFSPFLSHNLIPFRIITLNHITSSVGSSPSLLQLIEVYRAFLIKGTV